MYISASRQFDTVIVWEQRDANGNHRIKRYASPYECYIKVDDWKSARVKFAESVENGQPDHTLKEFLAVGRDMIDTSETHTSMYGDKLYKLTASDGRTWKRFTGSVPLDIRLWESDIPPELKVLSANYYKAPDPKIRVSFYDIETAYDPKRGFSSTLDPYAPINSIAFYHVWKDEYVVISVPPEFLKNKINSTMLDETLFGDVLSKFRTELVSSEAELLAMAIEEIQGCDLLSGWNSALFDDPYFAQRVELILGEEWFKMLSFPRGKLPYYREVEIMFRKQKQVQFDGRITIDYMELFKKFTVEDRDSWNLESVSADHLGERFKKLDYTGTLDDLYHGKYGRVDLNESEKVSNPDGLLLARIKREQIAQELERRGLQIPSR